VINKTRTALELLEAQYNIQYTQAQLVFSNTQLSLSQIISQIKTTTDPTVLAGLLIQKNIYISALIEAEKTELSLQLQYSKVSVFAELEEADFQQQQQEVAEKLAELAQNKWRDLNAVRAEWRNSTALTDIGETITNIISYVNITDNDIAGLDNNSNSLSLHWDFDMDVEIGDNVTNKLALLRDTIWHVLVAETVIAKNFIAVSVNQHLKRSTSSVSADATINNPSSSSDNSNNSPAPGSSSNTWAIVGGCIGAAVLIAVVIVVVVVVRRKRHDDYV